MDMFIGGRWRSAQAVREVTNPYTGDVIDTVPAATADDVEIALRAAECGAREMSRLPTHRRVDLLEAAALGVEARVDELAQVIVAEQGKPVREARAEADRIAPLLRYCAGEAARRNGEVLALDAQAAGTGRLGFTLPEPCGIVVAITPFNYPALLVSHKLGPALAAGNAVILKPAATTPLTALLLCECLLTAGFPDNALQCITGSGALLGPALCADPAVRKISFTGSFNVGNQIARAAGAKRLTCELGSHSAVIVLEDADPNVVAREIVRSGYSNAGQICISAQRVLVESSVHDSLLQQVLRGVDELRPGDPSSADTTLGPVIDRAEAARIVATIDASRAAGAEILRGGWADEALVAPTVVLDPPTSSDIWADELFGPAVAIRRCDDLSQAIETANNSRFGLSMSIFTQDIDRALRFAREIRSGMVHINSGPLFRVDPMPYGGVRESGFGKEGIRYAIEEMSEHKLVVIHPGRNA